MIESKISILFVGALSENVGGIETFVYNIVEYINKSIYSISFLTYYNSTPVYKDLLQSMGCTFYMVTSRRKNPLVNQKEIRNLFHQNRFDIVHCHMNSLSYILPCVEALKAKMRVIVHSHNSECKQSIHSLILHNLNKFRLKNLDVIRLAVSEKAGKFMFGNMKYKVIHNGIDTKKFKFDSKVRLEMRNKLDLSDELTILHVGAFKKQKNHNKVISVFYELQKLRNSVLLLVGEGDSQPDIIKLAEQLGISDKIKFLGRRNDVNEIMFASDIFLFPSLYEGFPIALIEAQCSGLKCIVSDTITQEALLPELCITESLGASDACWASHARSNESNESNEDNRAFWARRVEEFGLGIENEIAQLSNIYQSCMINRSHFHG